MVIYFVVFLLPFSSAFECFQEGITWDHTDDHQLVPGVESVELCQAECLDLEGEECVAFTWNRVEDPHFPRLCYIFSKTEHKVLCDYCVSGPKSCSCSYPGACDIVEDNLVGYQWGVETAKECHNNCTQVDGCSFYTWFDISSHPFQLDCFMYSSCESTDESCTGCFTGPVECGGPETTTRTSTSTTTTTVTTTVATTSDIATTLETNTTTTTSYGSSTPNPSSCEVPLLPVNASWACESNATALSCYLSCPQGYFSSSWDVPTYCTDGEWSVPPEDIKCKEGVALLVGGDLSEKSVELFGIGYHEILGFELPSPKKKHTTTFLNRGIVTCGGGFFTAEQKSCLSLNRSGSWQEHSHLSDVRYGHSSFALQDDLVLVGGYIPHARTSTEFYNMTEHHGWTQAGYLEEQHYDGCAVVISETQFMLIGGDKAEKKVVRYEALGGTFKEETGLNIGRVGHSCLFILTEEREGILVAGGFNEETSGRLTSTEFYDFKTHSWSEVADLNIARSGLRLVQIGQNILALGGKSTSGKSSGFFIENVESVEQLDLSSWTWSMAEDMLQPRSFHTVTLIPGNYFVH